MTSATKGAAFVIALLVVVAGVILFSLQLGDRAVPVEMTSPDTTTALPPPDTATHVTPSPPPLTAAMDEAMQKMADASIAFNIPDTVMTVGETHSIQLLIDLTHSEAEVGRAITLPGEVETQTIKVSSVVEAKLSGVGFTIQPLTHEIQPLSSVAPTEWRWSIMAASAGENQLHLVINALVEVEGEKMQRAIRTFDKEITVHVSFGRAIADFIGRNWQWLMATIIIPLVVYYWNSRKKGKGKSKKKHS